MSQTPTRAAVMGIWPFFGLLSLLQLLAALDLCVVDETMNQDAIYHATCEGVWMRFDHEGA